MAREHIRELAKVFEDGLWPEAGLGGPDPTESRRHLALAEVLRSIPEDDYLRLANAMLFSPDSPAASSAAYIWFIPDARVGGRVECFPATVFPGEEEHLVPFTQVIYLSPILERSAWDILVATVAHELAHVVLGHCLMPDSEEEYESQEQAAYELLCKWGFEKEAKKLHALGKWWKSWEQTMAEKLWKKGRVS